MRQEDAEQFEDDARAVGPTGKATGCLDVDACGLGFDGSYVEGLGEGHFGKGVELGSLYMG